MFIPSSLEIPMKSNRIRILLLHGHKNNLGGVANFYNDMEDEYKKAALIKKHFRTGHIQSSRLHRIKILKGADFVLRYVLFTFVVMSFRPNILHINPSIRINSVIRDYYFIILTKLFSPGSKILTHFRGWDSHTINNLRKKSRINHYIKKIVKYSDWIVVLAKSFKDELSRSFPLKKISVIYTNVDPKYFVRTIPKCCGNRYFLFLSRIEKEKGIFEIADAIKKLKAAGLTDGIKFVFAGDGTARLSLIRYCEQNGIRELVEFPGYLRGKEKISAFQKATAFIFPSYREGCPNAVLEALAAGLPVITTPVGALKELIENNENGIVIPFRSSEKIFDAVRNILKNVDYITHISMKNVKKAEQFKTEIIFKQIVDLYSRILC